MKSNQSIEKIFLGLIALVLIGCNASNIIQTPTPVPGPTPILDFVEADEYAVYEVVISEVRWGKGAPALIEAKTCSPDRFDEDRFYKKTPDLEKDTLDNFIAKDKNRGLLTSGDFTFDYIFIDFESYLKPLTSERSEPVIFDWETFRKDYENGSLIFVSRVGFNDKHTQSFLYATSVYAPLSGRGFYFMLIFTEGMWKIKETVLAWGS